MKQALRRERRAKLRLAQKASVATGQRREEAAPILTDARRIAHVVAVQAFDERQAMAIEWYVFGLHRLFVWQGWPGGTGRLCIIHRAAGNSGGYQGERLPLFHRRFSVV